MSDPRKSSCPACGARFRATVECSRCGADLGPLMTIAALARTHRLRARRLLLEDALAAALAEARAAQSLAATPSGEALVRLASLLGALRAQRLAAS